jgi:CRP-like cAMP-binding protein
MRRHLLRSRRLSLQSAINSIPRTQERLELTLWQLAYRYGRVVSGGLRLHLPMSHAQIAEIVATQRPSVTIALARLQAAGRLRRTGPHDWLLCGPDPTELASFAVAAGLES